MPVDQVQRLINAIDNNKTEFQYPLPISKKLRELLNILEPNESIDEVKQKVEQQTENINELKQQLNEMQKLLIKF